MLTTPILSLTGLFQSSPPPSEFGAGQILLIEKASGRWGYVIESGRCRYTGTSRDRLNLAEDSIIKFSTKGHYMYVVDERGKTRRILHVSQALMAPVLPSPASVQ